MIFYALVASDSCFAIDFWPSREAAEAALEQVIAYEPGFDPILRIVEIDLASVSLSDPITG